MFTPEQENIFPVYRYQNQIPKLRAGLQKSKSASSPVYFKFSTTYEKYSTLAYGRYMDRAPGNEVLLYTVLQVKEDGVTLFGFSTLAEKNCFQLLTSVSGVGPKGGLAILSLMRTRLSLRKRRLIHF